MESFAPDHLDRLGVGYRDLARDNPALIVVSITPYGQRGPAAAHPEVLAEAIQTVLRVAEVEMPYEKLKALTRGKEITLEDLAAFIDGLDIGREMKARLKALRPGNYTGLAGVLARK